ncbi:MAG: FAD-binding oxidoreductase [Bryobacteraceae bacterium]
MYPSPIVSSQPARESTPGILDHAIAEWRSALGPNAVITNDSDLARAGLCTFAIRRTVPVILKPADRAQVQHVMRIATHYGVPVYPVGSGKNWGYGSGVPSVSGCALLDLSRMTRITDFSEELAYVTVEPGVTQRQLMDFLTARQSTLWMDATGASPDCSLIGNTLERGFGHTPYSDHFGHCGNLEVVLPSGECVHTGFGRIPGASTAPVYKYGVGPYIDGIFTQSNFGVVTSMTIWLMPAPEYMQAFFFRCDDEDGLTRLVDALRPLRLNGTLQSAVHIGNGYKVLSGLRQYPWELTGGKTPLQPDQLRQLSQSMNFGYWNGSGALYGTKAQVAEARRMLKKALKGNVTRVQFLDEGLLGVAARFAKPLGWLTGWDLSKTLELVKPLFGLLRGQPTAEPIKSAFWRKRTEGKADADPDTEGCGLLWCSHTAPIRGEDARIMMEITERITLAHGFEPIVSITLLTERTLCSVVSISYDRSIDGEDKRAQECYHQLMAALLSAGYPPYRLGVQSGYSVPAEEGFRNLMQAIKDRIDPKNILAPSHYVR